MLLNNGTSRMTGDCHVRFCERLAGETPACLLGASSCPLLPEKKAATKEQLKSVNKFSLDGWLAFR